MRRLAMSPFNHFLILLIFCSTMQTGTVKFFNEARGYGFIVDDESQKEIFVHVTGLGGVVIREKDRVEYEIVDGKKGLNATKVKKI